MESEQILPVIPTLHDDALQLIHVSSVAFSFRFLWIGAVFVHVFSEHSASSFRTRSPSRLFFNDDGLGVEKQTLAGPSEHFHERSDAARVER